MNAQKVDVLAAMTEAAMDMSWTPDVDRMESARDAVAELIEAATSAFPPGDYTQDAHGLAVRAALANIGPTP